MPRDYTLGRPTGKPIDLAVQLDGGSMKIVGFPRAKSAPGKNDLQMEAAA